MIAKDGIPGSVFDKSGHFIKPSKIAAWAHLPPNLFVASDKSESSSATVRAIAASQRDVRYTMTKIKQNRKKQKKQKKGGFLSLQIKEMQKGPFEGEDEEVNLQEQRDTFQVIERVQKEARRVIEGTSLRHTMPVNEIPFPSIHNHINKMKNAHNISNLSINSARLPPPSPNNKSSLSFGKPNSARSSGGHESLQFIESLKHNTNATSANANISNALTQHVHKTGGEFKITWSNGNNNSNNSNNIHSTHISRLNFDISSTSLNATLNNNESSSSPVVPLRPVNPQMTTATDGGVPVQKKLTTLSPAVEKYRSSLSRAEDELKLKQELKEQAEREQEAERIDKLKKEAAILKKQQEETEEAEKNRTISIALDRVQQWRSPNVYRKIVGVFNGRRLSPAAVSELFSPSIRAAQRELSPMKNDNLLFFSPKLMKLQNDLKNDDGKVRNVKDCDLTLLTSVNADVMFELQQFQSSAQVQIVTSPTRNNDTFHKHLDDVKISPPFPAVSTSLECKQNSSTTDIHLLTKVTTASTTTHAANNINPQNIKQNIINNNNNVKGFPFMFKYDRANDSSLISVCSRLIDKFIENECLRRLRVAYKQKLKTDAKVEMTEMLKETKQTIAAKLKAMETCQDLTELQSLQEEVRLLQTTLNQMEYCFEHQHFISFVGHIQTDGNEVLSRRIDLESNDADFFEDLSVVPTIEYVSEKLGLNIAHPYVVTVFTQYNDCIERMISNAQEMQLLIDMNAKSCGGGQNNHSLLIRYTTGTIFQQRSEDDSFWGVASRDHRNFNNSAPSNNNNNNHNNVHRRFLREMRECLNVTLFSYHFQLFLKHLTLKDKQNCHKVLLTHIHHFSTNTVDAGWADLRKEANKLNRLADQSDTQHLQKIDQTRIKDEAKFDFDLRTIQTTQQNKQKGIKTMKELNNIEQAIVDAFAHTRKKSKAKSPRRNTNDNITPSPMASPSGRPSTSLLMLAENQKEQLRRQMKIKDAEHFFQYVQQLAGEDEYKLLSNDCLNVPVTIGEEHNDTVNSTYVIDDNKIAEPNHNHDHRVNIRNDEVVGKENLNNDPHNNNNNNNRSNNSTLTMVATMESPFHRANVNVNGMANDGEGKNVENDVLTTSASNKDDRELFLLQKMGCVKVKDLNKFPVPETVIWDNVARITQNLATGNIQFDQNYFHPHQPNNPSSRQKFLDRTYPVHSNDSSHFIVPTTDNLKRAFLSPSRVDGLPNPNNIAYVPLWEEERELLKNRNALVSVHDSEALSPRQALVAKRLLQSKAAAHGPLAEYKHDVLIPESRLKFFMKQQVDQSFSTNTNNKTDEFINPKAADTFSDDNVFGSEKLSARNRRSEKQKDLTTKGYDRWQFIGALNDDACLLQLKSNNPLLVNAKTSLIKAATTDNKPREPLADVEPWRLFEDEKEEQKCEKILLSNVNVNDDSHRSVESTSPRSVRFVKEHQETATTSKKMTSTIINTKQGETSNNSVAPLQLTSHVSKQTRQTNIQQHIINQRHIKLHQQIMQKNDLLLSPRPPSMPLSAFQNSKGSNNNRERAVRRMKLVTLLHEYTEQAHAFESSSNEEDNNDDNNKNEVGGRSATDKIKHKTKNNTLPLFLRMPKRKMHIENDKVTKY